MRDDKAVAEGDDLPPVFSERPIKIVTIAGEAFCNDEDLLDLRATDLRSLARLMFEAGFDVSRQLLLFRGDQQVGQSTIGRAAGVCDEC